MSGRCSPVRNSIDSIPAVPARPMGKRAGRAKRPGQANRCKTRPNEAKRGKKPSGRHGTRPSGSCCAWAQKECCCRIPPPVMSESHRSTGAVMAVLSAGGPGGAELESAFIPRASQAHAHPTMDLGHLPPQKKREVWGGMGRHGEAWGGRNALPSLSRTLQAEACATRRTVGIDRSLTGTSPREAGKSSNLINKIHGHPGILQSQLI